MEDLGGSRNGGGPSGRARHALDLQDHGFPQDIRHHLCDDRGGPNNASEVLNIYVFQTGFKYFHIGYASAPAVILIVFVFAVNLFLIRVRERSWSY